MFGLSFGASKEKTKQTTDQTQTTNQQQTGTNTTTTTGSSKTSGSQNTSSTGSSTTTQGTTGTSTQGGSSTGFGAGTLGAINDNIGDFIHNILTGGGANPAVQQLGDFDATKFIADTMASARASATDQLGESIRGVTDSVGGNASENSASALLANRMINATAASLAGVEANATKTAQDIMAQRAGVVTGATTGAENALAQVLAAIKGGEATSTQTGTQGQTTTGTTNTSENQNQTSSSQTDTTQTALEIINQLLQGTTHTTGTTTGTSSKIGGGASASI